MQFQFSNYAGRLNHPQNGWPVSQQTLLLLHCCCRCIIMDASKESVNQHPPETHVTHVPDSQVVHIPDFKDPAVLLALSSGDLAQCKRMFLDSNDWITPNLCRHVESLLPAWGAIENGTGSVTRRLFKKLLLPLSLKKGASLPLPSS
jgi:hypothetical protein